MTSSDRGRLENIDTVLVIITSLIYYKSEITQNGKTVKKLFCLILFRSIFLYIIF
jgi:hypothetical protein